MTEFTINLDDPQEIGDLIQNLRTLGWSHVVQQIEAQLPKPVPEKPPTAAELLRRFDEGGAADDEEFQATIGDMRRLLGESSVPVEKVAPQPVEELVGILSPDGPWIPASKVREVVAKMRGDASTGWASGTLGRDLWEAAARRVEALLPKEGQ